MPRARFNQDTQLWESPTESPRERIEREEREQDEARVLREMSEERDKLIQQPPGLYL